MGGHCFSFLLCFSHVLVLKLSWAPGSRRCRSPLSGSFYSSLNPYKSTERKDGVMNPSCTEQSQRETCSLWQNAYMHFPLLLVINTWK